MWSTLTPTTTTYRQELENSFERAAAVAVFHGHIRRGITSLKDGAVVAKQQNDNARGKGQCSFVLIHECLVTTV